MISLRYTFVPVEACNMCGASPDRFKLLGLRLNTSQGRRPKAAAGIAVSIKRCMECDLHFADPQPVPELLTDHYGLPPESYWQAGEFDLSDDYFAGQIGTAKELIGFRPGMSALDIGVGLGKGMLALERAGFDTMGIEPSPPFRAHAIKTHGIAPERIAETGVEGADFPAERFDFISFGAVLEHVYDPAGALERCLRWLKPGGVLHAEVPSSNHLAAGIINRYFRLRGTNYVTNLSPMHSPFHLYEFGLKSFERHAARAGYAIARHQCWVGTIHSLPRIAHRPLRWLMERSGTGQQLFVYLRKAAA